MHRRNGLSGLMRVKNDAMFIKRCIDSCINGLDELVIVYNDCTDGSEMIIEEMRSFYPNKIKVYPYPHHVLGANLTHREYELAKSLDDDDPRLLCNYYNFALSKATFRYAIKIDADQIYFTPELSKWRDYCINTDAVKCSFKVILGAIFQRYLSAYRLLGLKVKKRLPLMPAWLVKTFSDSYNEYARFLFSKSRACLSFSGINAWEENDVIEVSLGDRSTRINILPPFNGEGDHVIFEITPETYYRRFDMPYYNQARTNKYSLIEEFVHPYRIMFMGYLWIHVAAMRESSRDTIRELRHQNPKKFIPIKEFLKMDFKEIESMSDKVMFSLFQRILFSFIYPKYRKKLLEIFYND